jgi:hypothetical protein
MSGVDPQEPEESQAMGEEPIILARLIRSLLLRTDDAQPGEPIPIDWGYITGRVDRPRQLPSRTPAENPESASTHEGGPAE